MCLLPDVIPAKYELLSRLRGPPEVIRDFGLSECDDEQAPGMKSENVDGPMREKYSVVPNNGILNYV